MQNFFELQYKISTADFNINTMNIDSNGCQQFLSVFSACNLNQLVNEPTKQRNNSSSLLDFSVDIGDLFFIKLVLNFNVCKPPPLMNTYRDYNKINIEEFLNEFFNNSFNDYIY